MAVLVVLENPQHWKLKVPGVRVVSARDYLTDPRFGDHLRARVFNFWEPILAPWTGPYGGVPPFDKVKVDTIGPALEVGMARKLAEIELIATNPEPPTFDNTTAALERAGRTLSRARTIYDV